MTRHGLLAWFFAVVLACSACEGGVERSGVTLWSGPPPGGRRVLANAWDTLWSIGGDQADTTLLRPFIIASAREGVFVYDGIAKRVTAYSSEGRLRWVFGRPGNGPNEFDKVRDMHINEGGGVDLLDPRNNRILRLRADGTVQSRIPLTTVGYAEQLVSLGRDGFVLLTYDPDSAFAVIDTLGALRSRFNVRWEGFRRLDPLARQGAMATDGKRWVFAFAFGDGWFAFNGLRAERFSGRYIEHTDFPAIRSVARPGGVAKRMEGYNACSTCSISMSDSVLYVHFGGYSGLAQRVIDIYDVRSGAYGGSWVLPSIAKAVDVQGERVYVLVEDPYPHLLALRVKSRKQELSG